MLRTLETKGEFARRKHRAASCVSGWISAGRISSAAIIGTGQRALIWVERAEADLAAELIPGQQQAQVFPANERTPVDEAAQASEDGCDGSPAMPITSDLEIDRARRAKADANRAEHDAEAARRKLALDAGRYVDAAEAGAQVAMTTAETVNLISGALPNLAAALSERFQLPQKDVLRLLRDEFRNARARAASKLRDGAAKLPAFVTAMEES
jgi:hypothetical protein